MLILHSCCRNRWLGCSPCWTLTWHKLCVKINFQFCDKYDYLTEYTEWVLASIRRYKSWLLVILINKGCCKNNPFLKFCFRVIWHPNFKSPNPKLVYYGSILRGRAKNFEICMLLSWDIVKQNFKKGSFFAKNLYIGFLI